MCFSEKYGVIPKKCFPESHSSEASRRMNDILNHKVSYAQPLKATLSLQRCVSPQAFMLTFTERGFSGCV